jgi:membrane protease YdiL (CAAX protease family)
MRELLSERSICMISGVVFLVSGSYFLGSVFLHGFPFYVFDMLWRATCIGAVLISGFRPTVSPKQWGILLVVFCIEFLFYYFLSPEFPLYRILISIVLAPILEEFLFRGWVISKIEGSRKRKVLVSSLFFSLYHLKNAFVLTPLALIYQLLYAGFIVGPLFAWARLHFDTVFASILLHSGNNTIADVITPKLFPFIGKRTRYFS